jgi:RimJ/RimL family protein N-acetyltransferase
MELRSERLLLRPIQLTDADAIFRYRSDSVTNKYQGWIPKTIDDVSDFIMNRVSSNLNEPGTWFQFVIIFQESGELIGDAGLHFYDTENMQVEVGCTIENKYQQQGIATEALSEIVNYLFNKLNKHRVIASIDPRNTNSIKLVEKLGFSKEAHFKESILIDGVWVDDLIYGLLESEWTIIK